ncbi:MAG: hypothetical protein SP4CHLAM5_02890 [Chlamydiia bacterium]|nr:hypothetical protein [Chlamydiia bacterium]MCH9618163.1 hypothetical protein [Chlamydiia bacterium]MCH9624473.1 hypothetical protein [Chlamydiia bacterium]
MKKYLLLLISVKAFAAPMVFNATLSPANITHSIYHPKDRNIHRPYFSQRKLNRKAMVSPIKAIGSGTFLYNPQTNEIEYAIAYSGLSSAPVMIHLQAGYPHQDGPIIATIATKSSPKKMFSLNKDRAEDAARVAPENRSGFITGTVKLEKVGDLTGKTEPIREEKMLIQGGCYITIHTHLNELGEIRGQLHPLSTIPILKD